MFWVRLSVRAYESDMRIDFQLEFNIEYTNINANESATNYMPAKGYKWYFYSNFVAEIHIHSHKYTHE